MKCVRREAGMGRALAVFALATVGLSSVRAAEERSLSLDEYRERMKAAWVGQAGIDFANSGYRLWCANDAGRVNLRKGIAPPDSSHPSFNRCPNDIDYQIEADYAGVISPGCPQSVIELATWHDVKLTASNGSFGE